MTLPRRALVLGMGRSGEAALEALERHEVEVVAADRKLGNDGDLALLDGVGLLVKSPGVPGEHALVAGARRRGVPVWSEVELGYRLLPGVPIVGVTGTNGKTTTVELLGAIFRAAGRHVAVAGNVGRPLSAVERPDWVVCELSSFQLEDVHDLSCRVAVLLNLEPDHLDRHGSFAAYRAAKLRIFDRACSAVVPRGFDLGLEGVEFGPDDPLPAEPLLRGRHNRENAAAATAAARLSGIGDDAIAHALQTFAGVPHRLELVAEVGGVRYVNDSKATNVAAALRALEAYADEPVVLIAGGRGKGESFEPLAAALGLNVDAVFTIGEAGPEIAAAVGERATNAGDLQTAIQLAARATRGVVLLAPAAASYDQFANFEQRGEEFRRLVENLGA